MRAATQLADGSGSSAAAALRPSGVPVRAGRLAVGRSRHLLPTGGPALVVAGSGTVCWLGATDQHPPNLGRLTCRAEATVDGRGRVVLSRQVRAWLAVADPMAFEAVVMPAPDGGVLVVPVEGFERRVREVTP